MTSTDLVRGAEAAKEASRALRSLSPRKKEEVLLSLADGLEANEGAILGANAEDLAAASGLSGAMVDRLRLTADRISAMARSVRQIAAEPDPVGSISAMTTRPSGIRVAQMRIPLGVIAMIYEARPNVTVEAFALAWKSGNAVILRGGKEARRTNKALFEVVRAALVAVGVSPNVVFALPAEDREEVKALVGLVGLVDLVIPRGGEGLIRSVVEHARVPVIQHYKGVCHVYVDDGADLDKAARIIENAKLSRVSVCNALECLLVAESVAADLLARLAPLAVGGLEIRADERALQWIKGVPLTAGDLGAEFLAPILAVKVVSGIDEALDHIARYGSNHTEAIITEHLGRSDRFVREVDASCVVVNASTRFNDGGELGLGAEMGISTTKLHAYGPMGAIHLTTQKWIVVGDGQIRD